MSFMESILKRNIPVCDKCIATMFVQDMKDGKLTIEDFKEYMVQDSIYLKNYARVYGKAIYHAETLREIQLYYSMLGFVTDTESAVRLNYLRQSGMTDDDIEFIDPLPENQNYIDFLFEPICRQRRTLQGCLCTVLHRRSRTMHYPVNFPASKRHIAY